MVYCYSSKPSKPFFHGKQKMLKMQLTLPCNVSLSITPCNFFCTLQSYFIVSFVLPRQDFCYCSNQYLKLQNWCQLSSLVAHWLLVPGEHGSNKIKDKLSQKASNFQKKPILNYKNRS